MYNIQIFEQLTINCLKCFITANVFERPLFIEFNKTGIGTLLDRVIASGRWSFLFFCFPHTIHLYLSLNVFRSR